MKVDLYDGYNNFSAKWKKDNTILLGVTGSRAYGTGTEDSDYDCTGIVVPTKEYVYGLNTFLTARNQNGKVGKLEIDLKLFSLQKLLRLLVSGDLGSLEVLYLDDYKVLTEEGNMLVESRELFLTKQIERGTGGMGESVRRRMVKNYEKELERGNDLGYKAKDAMHAVRVLTSALEILETGTFQAKRYNAEELKQIREGKYSFNEMVEMLENYKEILNRENEKTKLPEKVGMEKVNSLAIKVMETFYDK